VDCLAHMRTQEKTRIEPEKAAEDAWVAQVQAIFSMGLFLHAKSWYTGANVPGKRIEALNFVGGVPLYMRSVRESAEAGYKGFVISGSSVKGNA